MKESKSTLITRKSTILCFFLLLLTNCEKSTNHKTEIKCRNFLSGSWNISRIRQINDSANNHNFDTTFQGQAFYLNDLNISSESEFNEGSYCFGSLFGEHFDFCILDVGYRYKNRFPSSLVIRDFSESQDVPTFNKFIAGTWNVEDFIPNNSFKLHKWVRINGINYTDELYFVRDF